jgi:hypothetical protein
MMERACIKFHASGCGEYALIIHHKNSHPVEYVKSTALSFTARVILLLMLHAYPVLMSSLLVTALIYGDWAHCNCWYKHCAEEARKTTGRRTSHVYIAVGLKEGFF